MKQKPRNGKHFLGLIVGGEARLQAVMRGALAERGVLVVECWSAANSLDRRPLPPGLEIVLIVRDSAISRQVRDRLAYGAKQAGVFVVDARNMHEVSGALDRQGYKAPPIEFESEPANQPEEAPVQSETDKDKRLRLGQLIARKRKDKGMTATAVGRAIGFSGSYVLAIEKGGGKINPTDQVLSAVERYWDLPARSFPRLSTRNNHRIPAPAAPAPPPVVSAPEVVRGPVVDLPVPPPPVVPAFVPIDAGIDGKDTHPEHVRLHLQVLAIQSRMRGLGIARIELTPTALTIAQLENA